jgi:hypothetical protein
METAIIIQTEVAQKLIKEGSKDYDRVASIYNLPIEIVYAVAKMRLKYVYSNES